MCCLHVLATVLAGTAGERAELVRQLRLQVVAVRVFEKRFRPWIDNQAIDEVGHECRETRLFAKRCVEVGVGCRSARDGGSAEQEDEAQSKDTTIHVRDSR